MPDHSRGNGDDFDGAMMKRALALAVRSGREGEYPYGVVICRDGAVVAESINCVAREHDVTRHAEVVAVSQAQKVLGRPSLEGCTIYVTAEPCVYCCYAIRETRITRVVYALHSPHMGGVSKWNVLTDRGISHAMPEVFAPPPEIVGGFMAYEVERTLLARHPLMWKVIKLRGLFVASPIKNDGAGAGAGAQGRPRNGPMQSVMRILRRQFFDRFGRGG